MKPFLLFPLVICMLLAACENAEEKHAREERESREAALVYQRKVLREFASNAKLYVQNQLKYPQSAQFRNLYFSRGKFNNHDKEKSLFLCGEVNAKNSLGGYVGFQPFSARPEYSYIDDVPEMHDVWLMHCSNRLDVPPDSI